MANLKKDFGKIYDRNVRRIYRFVFLKVNSSEVAKDLTAQTFLNYWEAFKKRENQSDKKSIENSSAFLYQIARNLVIDYYRKKGQAETISTEYVKLTDTRPDPEEKAALEFDFNQVKKALRNLKDIYQDVIILRYLNGLSFREIAKILKKSEGAARVTLHRALKSLREEMDLED